MPFRPPFLWAGKRLCRTRSWGPRYIVLAGRAKKYHSRRYFDYITTCHIPTVQFHKIKSLSRCRGMLQCIFLSDLVTADGRYLESFVFDPGPFKRRSNNCFPQEGPTKGDWDTWFNFWHNDATTRWKLNPLGRWTHPTHRKWLWYSSSIDDLPRVEDGIVYYYLPAQSKRCTHSGLAYALAWKEPLRVNHVIGEPVSVQGPTTSL
jgi:hypothetical protein